MASTEEQRARWKKYREKYKEKRAAYQKEYMKKHMKKLYAEMTSEEKAKCVEYTRRWRKKNPDYRKYEINKPWTSHYEHARQRCDNPNNHKYKYYGGRGIRFLMTRDDFKYLYERDSASQMFRPSIDRIDNDGDYALENCQFLELADNSRKANA